MMSSKSGAPVTSEDNAVKRVEFGLQGLIEYLEETSESDWIVDRVRTKDGRGCVMSHVFDYGGGDNGGSEAWDYFEECFATTYMIYPVNDGTHPKYKQATPKQRVIAYLKDLRDGEEKTTPQLWNEYETRLTAESNGSPDDKGYTSTPTVS